MVITSLAQDCRLPGPSFATARQRRMMCWLSRYRDNQHYSDIAVMPMTGADPCCEGEFLMTVSA